MSSAKNINQKVLIIEDEKQLLDVLRRKLEKENFDVIEAQDGVLGLELALSEKPDIILLDIILPKMDGLTLVDKLKEDDEGRKIPVIILSNLENAETIHKSKEKGVNEYLVKTSWSLDDVVNSIRSVLDK